VTPAAALKKAKLERRVSAESVKEELANTVVGCAECHGMNPGAHRDAFEHNGKKIHVLVSPRDCATCHPSESEQYGKNLMAHARNNLAGNKLYETLVNAVNGVQKLQGGKTTLTPPDDRANADSCFHCHGTAVEVKGLRTRDTDYGEMEFPALTGWPNQGVGRVNPDDSRGSCSACHSRHEFSIETARKPYTCSQCHKGPDVPAYKAYEVSKHGNLASARGSSWKFGEVPWKVGEDFGAPTCASCHVSLLVNSEGAVVAQRTHQMSDRIPLRILGLIYSHPHPKSPDTSIIRNQEGQPLPTTLDGRIAADFLIGPEEAAKRKETMQRVCLACHSTEWVNGHWERFEATVKTADEMTKTATELMTRAWKEGIADPKASLFDEALEKSWVEQWLFYGNSTRFASAMMGADYGVFAQGRWYLAKNIQEMIDRVRILSTVKAKK
jgi:hypothetical protein